MSTVKPVTQNVKFAIGECPLCNADILANASVAIDFTLGPVDYRLGKAQVKVVGNPSLRSLSVHHDCTPTERAEASDDH